MTAYFLCNIPAKNYQNRFMYVDVLEIQCSVMFLGHSVFVGLLLSKQWCCDLQTVPVKTTMVVALNFVLLQRFHITVTAIQATDLLQTIAPVKVCTSNVKVCICTPADTAAAVSFCFMRLEFERYSQN